MNPDLLIPATAALLDGWCGPVMWGPVPSVYSCQGHFLAYRHGGHLDAFDLNGWAEIGDLALDLSRAECRDRVARVLAEQSGERIVGPGKMTYSGWPARWGFDFEAEEVQRSNEPGNAGPWPYELDLSADLATALTNLDPLDDRRLPDDSRLVDALALAAVARATFTTGDQP